MHITKDSNHNSAMRRAVKETILLGVIFLIALFLFFTAVHHIATIEKNHELENRPKGLILGWLATITIGLILGKTRQTEGTALPKALVVVRESLQVIMLLLFFAMLSYASYWVYTTRALIVHRPWGLLIGWFAFLMFVTCFVRTRHLLRFARRKQ